MANMHKLRLRKGREKAVINHHPWLFSGAIEKISGEVQDGDIVEVCDQTDKFLAYGFYNSNSKIIVRLFSFKHRDVIDKDFWRRRIESAIEFRKKFIDQDKTNVYRLIHSEGDFLPGLVVDKYGEYLVVQFSTLGMELRRDEIISILKEILGTEARTSRFGPGVKGIYDRSDIPSRKIEGLSPYSGLVWGAVPDMVEVKENGLKFLVDIKKGQKTGFFIDQRDNRERIAELSLGKRVLNCFCYTGGFSVSAAAGGAKSVTSVDISSDAIELARENMKRNCLLNENSNSISSVPISPISSFVVDDVFEYLRKLKKGRQEFDMIILDPPAFVKSRESVRAAARGYKDINMQAMHLLAKDGLLVTCSCSQHIDRMLFQKIVHDAAIDAGRDLQIIEIRGQAPDHPINCAHPEGEYLKCLICRVI